MPISREPSLRNWMKWSSSSSNASNASPAPANTGPAEIIHLGGSRLESPLIAIPPTTIGDRRLTAWPCGPPPAPPASGLTRANTDAAGLGRRPQNDPDAAEQTSRSSLAPPTLRPAPGRSQQPDVDSFALMSPALSVTSGYHASFFPQKPHEAGEDRAGDRSPASTTSAVSSHLSSVRPPAPLRTRDALASPLTPATSFASGPKTGPLQINTDSFYFGEPSPEIMSVVSSPGSRPPLHMKSPSLSGHFPVRTSSKGPNAQPNNLRRSRSAVDNNRGFQEQHSLRSTSQDAREDRELEWPLSPIPFEDVDALASPSSSTSTLPQVLVDDYSPPNNGPPKRPLPKIISIPALHAEKKRSQAESNGNEAPQVVATVRRPRHTTQERLWLHRNYRGEAAFLKAWGLDIEQGQDREEGKSILQELMQAEDDEVEDSLVGARVQQQQHSPSPEWTKSSSTTSVDEAGLHVIEEEDSKSPRLPPSDQTLNASRYSPANRRANAPSSARTRLPSSRAHYRSESETSVLGSYLETWEK